MDAHALLRSQGWRGSGHTLHPTDDLTGLAKPLLISRKDNKLGVGKKEHCTSDQWWLNAFDQQLQGLDTTSNKGAVVQTLQHGALDKIALGAAGKYRGLYASFVRGGVLEGSIFTPPASGATTPRTAASTSETEDAPTPSESREERKARRAAKRRSKAERLLARGGSDMSDVEAILAARRQQKLDRKALETKDERHARREAKRKRKELRRTGLGG